MKTKKLPWVLGTGVIAILLLGLLYAAFGVQRNDDGAISSQAVANWGGGEQLIYGAPEGTGTPVAVQVNEDGHLITEPPISRIFDILPSRGSSTLTVSSAITNSVVFSATAGHGLSITDTIFFSDAASQQYQQVEVVIIATNIITIDTPLDRAWSGVHPYGLTQMNVDGSSVPVTFALSVPSGMNLEVIRIIVHIEDNSAMDDGKFGAVTALTNGFVVRVNRANGTSYETIMNVKTNGEFAQRSYDIAYSDNAPSGTYGFRSRRTFGGDNRNGSAIFLNGTNGDILECIVQDDLTGLLGFGISIQGHIGH